MTNWLNGLFGEAAAPILSLILTIALVIIVALVFLWLIRRFLKGGFSNRHNPNLRLQVVDATAIDNRRKLVLVRRDNVEHLIVIGGQNDLIVESGIQTNIQAASPVPPRSKTKQAATSQPVPRPLQAAPSPKQATPQAKAITTQPVERSIDTISTPTAAKPSIAATPTQHIKQSPQPTTDKVPDVEIADARTNKPTMDDEMDELINTLTTKSG